MPQLVKASLSSQPRRKSTKLRLQRRRDKDYGTHMLNGWADLERPLPCGSYEKNYRIWAFGIFVDRKGIKLTNR